MENSSLILAISKLAAAGEQPGFTLEQMIELLDHEIDGVALVVDGHEHGQFGRRSIQWSSGTQCGLLLAHVSTP